MFRARGGNPWLAELSLATGAMASYTFTFLGILSLTPFLRAEFDLSASEIGVIAATPSTAALLTTYPAARATRGIDATKVTAVSQLVLVGAAFVEVTARGFAMLILAAMLVGASSALVNPATTVLASALVPVRRRGAAMSVKQTGVTVGGAAAGVLVPAIAAFGDWRFALFPAAGVALLVAVWAFRTHPRTRGGVVILSDVLPSPVSRFRLAWFGFAMAGVQIAVFGYLSLYLVEARHFSPAAAGSALSAALLAGGVSRLGSGALSDRVRSRVRVLRRLAVVGICGLAVLPVAPVALVWPLVVGVGIGSVGWNGVFLAAITESATAGGVVRATAFGMTYIYLGGLAVPPLLGVVLDATEWRSFWMVAAVLTAAAAAALGIRPFSNATSSRPELA